MNEVHSTCIICNSQFTIRKNKANKFCGISCYRIHQKSGNYKKGSSRVYNCKECNSTVVGRSKTSKRNGTQSNNIFCNRDCYDLHRKKIKEDNFKNCTNCGKKLGFKEGHNYNAKYCDSNCRFEYKKSKDRNCISCGVWFSSLKWNSSIKRLVADNFRKTCSHDCYIKNIKTDISRKEKISAAFIGSKHPNWQGGSSYLNKRGFRGADWKIVREKAIVRDKERCCGCGMNREDHFKKYNCDLNVNHIKPFYQFGGMTRNANKLNNLETLCRSCHTKADWKYRRENSIQLNLAL